MRLRAAVASATLVLAGLVTTSQAAAAVPDATGSIALTPNVEWTDPQLGVAASDDGFAYRVAYGRDAGFHYRSLPDGGTVAIPHMDGAVLDSVVGGVVALRHGTEETPWPLDHVTLWRAADGTTTTFALSADETYLGQTGEDIVLPRAGQRRHLPALPPHTWRYRHGARPGPLRARQERGGRRPGCAGAVR